MSIGFCTDVVEPNQVSRAFTVIYILAGASCVGGALVLMVQSILEEAAQRTSLRYRQILEMDSFKKAFFRENQDSWLASLQIIQRTMPVKEATLSYDEFRRCLEGCDCHLSDENFLKVIQTYDTKQDGYIRYDDFNRMFKGTDKILFTLQNNDKRFLIRFCLRIYCTISPLFLDETQRIYLIFILYICLGVMWGIINQGWDPITATVSE